MKNDLEHKKRTVLIRTPDHHLRVFVSSTLNELAAERKAVQQALTKLRLAPIMFELGARPHPAQDLYQAYLSQSHIFVGIYWQSYGWIGPGMQISGLEDEYNRSTGMPRLIYIKSPASEQDPALKHMLGRIRDENASSYKHFTTSNELRKLVENDLILLLTEYFETARAEEQPQSGLAPTTPTNVPVPRNPIIGRELELETAHNLLIRDDVALITLTGPAGTGKSRLGIQIALELRDHFSDGVYMVGLESIRDPELVIPSIAKTLNITETAGGLSLLDLLKRQLRTKQMLLLLDNFEQVLPAAPQVADVLEACPKVKILVTSRASLHLRAEKELPIPPLKVPPLKEALELKSLSQYSAVQLFILRCQAVKADFQITNENAPAVAEICHRLDGLPLAIELAAARIKLFPPKTLLSRLERRFDVLRGGTIDLPERHHTMYSAINWSYSLLDENERRLFQRLSVFSGGWSVDAAAAICSAENQGQMEILDGLQMLMDNNLLRSPEETLSEARLQMLESIREFAHDHLVESGESEVIHQRHAQYFASLAEQAEKEKFGSEQQLAWRIRIETELDNLRAAMDWCLENKQYTCELRLATSMWRFWWTHGYWREGIRRLELGLAGPEPSAGAIRARAFTRMGWMMNKVGENSRSVASLQEAVTLWRQINDQTGLALALSNLGGVLVPFDHDKAVGVLEEALKIRQGLTGQPGLYATMMNLGIALASQGENKRANELFTESLRLARLVNDDYSMGITLINLGDAYTNDGDYSAAEAYFGEAERIYKNLEDRSGLAEVTRGRGRIALQSGDYAGALGLFSEALSICFELEIISTTIVIIEDIALAAQKQDNPVKSIVLLSACDSYRDKIRIKRIPTHQADCMACLASARASIEETAYTTAQAEGWKMTLEQAVAYAIR